MNQSHSKYWIYQLPYVTTAIIAANKNILDFVPISMICQF